ncbi:PAS domain-containing sensor histidine kinase [Roseiterribacter gracilis]|uniref:histidine kinase n=1 Tax=Roseiterribacter gracilis TaxID=2812848 RepID=A0A8S8X8B6_9PROT|nr:hypothetical protein TMPK1_19200 [Rhodospirillales bacterium TMPK1]
MDLRHAIECDAPEPAPLPPGSYRAILQESHDAAIVLDDDMKIVFANASAVRMFGYSRRALLGRPIDRLLPESARKQHVGWMRSMQRAEVHSRPMGPRGRIQALRADGSLIWIEGTVVAYQIAGAPYYAALLRDATQCVEAEEQLQQLAADAQRLARARSSFIANMSHELRTPLNAVIGFAECVAKASVGDLPDKYREYGTHIHEAGEHLLAVINDILAMSELESRQRLLHETELRVRDVADQVCRMLSIRAAKGGHRIVADVPAHLLLYGDAVALPQILINLVGNSLKYSTQPGCVRIAARLLDGGELEIAVEDQGVGMAREEVSQATQPFRRFAKDSLANVAGTGLGLAIVDALVWLHGARMTIESELGVGTTVRLLFPTGRVRFAS